MSKPKIISERCWVLASGQYSDYSVLCVVRGSKADAELLAARMNASGTQSYDEVEVEEMTVVRPKDVQMVEILTMSVEVYDTGKAAETKTSIRAMWNIEDDEGQVAASWRWIRAPYIESRGGRLDVRGIDHERVRKVFSDRRAALMADDALRSRKEATGKR